MSEPTTENTTDQSVTESAPEVTATPEPQQAAGTATETPAPAAETPAAERNFRKTRRGYVVSDKMDKTVVVEVEDRVKHALYGKVLRRSQRVKAHDENNEVGVGDLVRIMETRPLSATKRYRVVEIVEKAR